MYSEGKDQDDLRSSLRQRSKRLQRSEENKVCQELYTQPKLSLKYKGNRYSQICKCLKAYNHLGKNCLIMKFTQQEMNQIKDSGKKETVKEMVVNILEILN